MILIQVIVTMIFHFRESGQCSTRGLYSGFQQEGYIQHMFRA